MVKCCTRISFTLVVDTLYRASLPAQSLMFLRTRSGALQVQEASVTWRLGLLSSAAFHMGKHLVQYKKRLQTVLSVCFDTTSQASLPPGTSCTQRSDLVLRAA